MRATRCAWGYVCTDKGFWHFWKDRWTGLHILGLFTIPWDYHAFRKQVKEET